MRAHVGTPFPGRERISLGERFKSLYNAVVTGWPVQATWRKKRRVLRNNLGLALRYPWLFDDARQSAGLDRIDDLVRGKTIAVVGNASCILNHQAGPEIDAHDVVIRFNKGFIVQPESQGQKTTIHCLATDIPLETINKAWPDASLFYVSPVRAYLNRDLAREPDRCICLPVGAWKSLSEQMHNLRPSAGMLIIDYLLHRGHAKQISLYGFDWKRTKTFYHQNKIKDWHSGEAERILVLEWARAEPGRLRFDYCPMDDIEPA